MKGILFMALGAILVWAALMGGLMSWSTIRTSDKGVCMVEHQNFYKETLWKESCWRHYAEHKN